ncbi:hypothetical protein Pst134EB_018091 [Puccinia striiformis f. sp. tritici]|nr:hypothetical protein Pst134EB_018091 [Puccinia striiformis f. sp. tritici]
MNRHHSLVGWLSLTFLNITFASIPAPLTIQPGLTPNINNTQCQLYPTTIESWKQLEVDQFLSNFPGGKDTSLDDFTFGNHITNFVCGLGGIAWLDTQCLPFQGSLWFTLCSLQEWNLYVNSLYDAATAAVAQIKGRSHKAELLEEEAPVADEMFQSTMHIHERRSLTKQSLPAADHLSPDAVYESQSSCGQASRIGRKLRSLLANRNIRPPTKQGNATLFDKTIGLGRISRERSIRDEKAFLRIKNNLVSAYEPTEDQRLLKRSAPQDIPKDHFATVSHKDLRKRKATRLNADRDYRFFLNKVERHKRLLDQLL